MTPDHRFIAVGIYVNSAIYCVLLFAGGVLAGNPIVWKLAIATAGTCSVAYMLQLLAIDLPRAVPIAVFTALSTWALGTLGGIELLVHP